MRFWFVESNVSTAHVVSVLVFSRHVQQLLWRFLRKFSLIFFGCKFGQHLSNITCIAFVHKYAIPGCLIRSFSFAFHKTFYTCWWISSGTSIIWIWMRFYNNPDRALSMLESQICKDDPSWAVTFFDIACTRKPHSSDVTSLPKYTTPKALKKLSGLCCCLTPGLSCLALW